MEKPDYNLRKRVVLEGALKNLENNVFLNKQNTTRATFLKCGTP